MNDSLTPQRSSRRWRKALATVLLVLRGATAAAPSGTATLVLSTQASSTVDSVEVTATVAPADPSGPTPTGNVKFELVSGAGPAIHVALDTTGRATLVLPYRYAYAQTSNIDLGPVYTDVVLPVGLHTISAQYLGDRTYRFAYPPALLKLQVAKARTITSLTSSQAGQAVTYSALVSMVPSSICCRDPIISYAGTPSSAYIWPNLHPGNPTGGVNFFSGPTLIGSAPVQLASRPDGAVIARITVSPQNDPVTAVYSGDSNYEPSDTTPASLTSLVNAASHNSSSFAPEGMVTAFGKNLAAMNWQAAEPIPGFGGISANIVDSTGVSLAAPISRVSPAQIDLIIPASVAAGPATASLITASGVRLSRPITIGSTAPGLFAANGNGSGVAAAHIVRIDAQGAVTIENVAQFDAAGNQWIPSPIALDSGYVFLILSGTGIRHHSPDANVVCTLGSQTVTPFYAGAGSTYSGLDQLNLELPHTLAGAGKINVTLLIDGSASNTVSVTIQ